MLLLQCFEFPLRKAAVLSEQEVSSIFGNVRQILSLNQELMSRLEDADQIGRAFLQMAPFLKLYSMYANNHEKALATLLVGEDCRLVRLSLLPMLTKFSFGALHRSGTKNVLSSALLGANRRSYLRCMD